MLHRTLSFFPSQNIIFSTEKLFAPKGGSLDLNNAQFAINEQYLNPEFGARQLMPLPMFKSFSIEELARVYALGDIRVFNPNSNIIVEGEHSWGFFIILEGFVGVYKSGHAGLTDHRLSTMGVGKAFGEMSLIDRKPRSATVVAETRVVVFCLEGDTWSKVLQDDARTASRFYQNFSILLSNRLRALDGEFILSQKQLWKFALRNTGS